MARRRPFPYLEYRTSTTLGEPESTYRRRLDITREAPDAMAVRTVPTPVQLSASTAVSPPGWFAGAGDDRDHAVRSWIPDRAGFLTTVCGKPSAHAGRGVNRPCPDCEKIIGAAQGGAR